MGGSGKKELMEAVELLKEPNVVAALQKPHIK